jgi:hypothetical protein
MEKDWQARFEPARPSNMWLLELFGDPVLLILGFLHFVVQFEAKPDRYRLFDTRPPDRLT